MISFELVPNSTSVAFSARSASADPNSAALSAQVSSERSETLPNIDPERSTRISVFPPRAGTFDSECCNAASRGACQRTFETALYAA